jgi:hypothetical protein
MPYQHDMSADGTTLCRLTLMVGETLLALLWTPAADVRGTAGSRHNVQLCGGAPGDPGRLIVPQSGRAWSSTGL